MNANRLAVYNKAEGVDAFWVGLQTAKIRCQDTALLTRDDAIGTSQEGSYVLVAGPDNVVERRVVKPGQQVGELRVIESGLDPSDWVVTEGVQRAIPGAKIAPQRSELASAAADSSDLE